MSKAILILGESGSGKSTSTENLDPAKTFYINVVGKDLPFAKWKSKYTLLTKTETGHTGNMIVADKADQIIKTLEFIDKQYSHIENIIIDDKLKCHL